MRRAKKNDKIKLFIFHHGILIKIKRKASMFKSKKEKKQIFKQELAALLENNDQEINLSEKELNLFGFYSPPLAA